MKKLEERGVVIRFVIGRRFLHALILTGYYIDTYFLEHLMINYLLLFPWQYSHYLNSSLEVF
jgi:hypothetical protein